MLRNRGILTTTQKVVLQYILAGVSSEETCSILRITYKTLETHRSNIYRRTGITGGVNVAKLFNWALAHDLYDPARVTIPSNPIQAFPSIYLIQDGTGRVKIGYSERVKERLKQIQSTECPTCKLIAHFPGSYGVERYLHKKYESYRLSGEWFKLTDSQITEIKDFMTSDLMMLAISLATEL
jgi:DNA-binding CsgD family transcriptional regulator